MSEPGFWDRSEEARHTVAALKQARKRPWPTGARATSR